MLKRKRCNKIVALQDQTDTCLHDEVQLKTNVIDLYHNLYSSARISYIYFPKLARPVTLEEVRSMLFSMKSFKSSDPDGFHPFFFKSQWELVGKSLHKIV